MGLCKVIFCSRRNRFILLALLGDIYAEDLHVRGLHGKASWLSLFLSSSAAAFYVCRTESDRVGLEMQATWFGKTSPKSLFFFKTSDRATVHITQWERLFGIWKELEAGRTF